ncbi:metal-sulfur cluster assembly factor [Salinibaculum salinum]|uniref:metal-sulfur cluster assembly factor n=1 Tax=Salinibaculum salinum TaxID=3131996 RepID=UPI0030EDBBF3
MMQEYAEAQVRNQLTKVLDPCSCFTDDPVNIVDLGLVEDVTVTDETVHVKLLLTSPGCTYAPDIERDVKQKVGSLEGITSVEVAQVTDQLWTRDRMDNTVRETRRERIHSRMEAAGITPYYD